MIKLSILIPLWNQEQLIVKALDSIPRRDDVEVIVRDDGSTDNSLSVVKQYKVDHPELNLKVTANDKNYGVHYTANKLVSDITGEYYHFLGNDDYLITDEYIKAMNEIGDEDVVYINLRINNGTVFVLSPDTRRYYCADTTKIVRTEFAKGIKFPENRIADGDWFYNEELLKRNPKCKYTGIVAYHYNFPREGSLIDLKLRGLIEERD